MSRACVTLLLATTAAAQAVVLPPIAATNPPGGSVVYSFNVFYSTSSTTTPHDSRSQMIYPTSDVAIPAGLWNNIAFRRPMAPNIGNANSACTANATIVLSTSPTPHTSPSTTFANNHGQNQTTVLNGMVNLPPRFNGTWPAPWETIAFTTPFVFIRASGQSLVVDLLQTGNTATSSWIVEAYNRDTGNRENNGQFQSNCKFSTGQPNGGLGHNNPYLGGSWLVSYSGGMPSGLMGVGAIGTRGAGQMWGSLLLPIDLSVFGAPGCNWSVSAELTVPLSSSSSSYPWPSIPIPNDPSLNQAVFYDHAIFVDPPANAWGAATTWSSKWTIGSGTGPAGSLVNNTGANATGATGFVTQPSAVAIQLN